MSTRPLLIITAVVVVAMAAMSAWALTQVSPGARVPIHWGIDGQPDGYADAWVALVATPVVAAITGVLLAVAPRYDPRRENLARSASAYRWIGASALVLLAALHFLLILAALGNEVDMARFAGMGAGVLFVVAGNFLGKTRSSWFLGIRTPWTLSSERSWDRTHRLGGYLFMAVGVVVALVALFLPPQAFFWTLMAGLLGAIGFLFVYSYAVWRDDPDRRTL